MIWLIIGVLPFIALLVWALLKAPGITLIVLGLTVGLAAFILSAMYGMWEMGWILQCGDQSGFLSGHDC